MHSAISFIKEKVKSSEQTSFKEVASEINISDIVWSTNVWRW